MTLPARLARHLRASGLIPDGARCLVAVSGGGDSVALLHLLREVGGFPLRVAHLDHTLREDSDEDRAFVRRLCRSVGVPVHTARADVGGWARRHGLSREAAGRRLRYRYLQAVRRRTGCDVILTAHTADDQAETVLLRVLAGTGIAGLGAIMPRRRDGVVRPLLPFTRQELRAWLTERGHAWREDATNEVPEAPRTRVRLLLMPILREWNPQVSLALSRLARAAREDERHLRRQAILHLDRHGLELGALRRASRALRSRILGLAARRAGTRLEGRHLDALEDLLQGTSGRQVGLPGGVLARRTPSSLILQRSAETAPRPAPVLLPPAPFRLDLPEWGLRLAGDLDWREPSEDSVSLDADLLRSPLRLRPRADGDRFHGPGGTTTLKKYLHARGVPRWSRDRVPLLECGQQVVWIVGHRADPAFLAAPDSARVLRLTASPLDRSALPPAEAPAP